jgi:hypothetical protein
MTDTKFYATPLTDEFYRVKDTDEPGYECQFARGLEQKLAQMTEERDTWRQRFLETSMKLGRSSVKLALAHDALERIVKWKLPPATYKDWSEVDKGHADIPREIPCTFSFAYGTNGERDYFRKIAREALDGIEP